MNLNFFKMLITSVLVMGICIVPAAALTADDLGGRVPAWAEPAVDKALRYDLFDGIDDTIDVSSSASRAQIAYILVNCFGSDEKADMKGFTDVTYGTWQHDAMAKAAYMQVFKGDGNGTIRPDDSITREEFFTVIARAFLIDPTDTYSLSEFPDADTVSSWALSYVKALVKSGYVNGSDGKILPKSNVTLAEAVQVISNIVKSAFVSESTSHVTYNGNTVVTGKDIVLTKVTVDGDLYVGDGVKSLTLDGCTINGNIITRGAAADSSESGIALKNTVVQNDVFIYSAIGETVKVTIANERLFSTRYKSGIEGCIFIQTDAVLSASKLTVKNIIVTAPEVNVELDSIRISEFEIAEDANGVTIEVGKDAHIENMVINAGSSALAGEGSISNIAVNASNVNIMVSNVDAISVASGKTGVMAGSTIIKSGQTAYITDGVAVLGKKPSATDSASGSTGSSDPTGSSGGNAASSEILSPYLDKLYALEGKYSALVSELFESVRGQYEAGASYLSLYASVAPRLTELQSACDAEYNSIVSEISGVISANSLDSSILQDIASYYDGVKSSMSSHYMQYIQLP